MSISDLIIKFWVGYLDKDRAFDKILNHYVQMLNQLLFKKWIKWMTFALIWGSYRVLLRWLQDFSLNFHDTEYEDIKLLPMLLSLVNTHTLFYYSILLCIMKYSWWYNIYIALPLAPDFSCIFDTY